MKRFFSVFLALCLVMGCAATALAGKAVNDLEISVWADRDTVSIGETVTISYQITGGSDPYYVYASGTVYYDDASDPELHGGRLNKYLDISLDDYAAASGSFTVTPSEGQQISISVGVNDQNEEYASGWLDITVLNAPAAPPVAVTITPNQGDAKPGDTVSASYSVDLGGKEADYINTYVDQFGYYMNRNENKGGLAGIISDVLSVGTNTFDFDVSLRTESDWSLFKYTKAFHSDTTGSLGQAGWKQVNGCWYYGDATGTPVTGWLKIGDYWYYFSNAGVMQANTTTSSSIYDENNQFVGYETQRLDEEGHMITDQWIEEKYTYYTTDEDGNEVEETYGSGRWQYADPAGNLAEGWTYLGNAWYYFNSNKNMLTGWRKLAGKWYYLGDNGALRTGWVQDGDDWFYTDANGVLQLGWQAIDGAWYYFKMGGKMAAGEWIQSGADYYYLNQNGTLATGWINDQGGWYYTDANGARQTGWQAIDGSWYYFAGSGRMTANDWLLSGGNWYYFGSNGAMVTAPVSIDGQYHLFDSNGVWLGAQ